MEERLTYSGGELACRHSLLLACQEGEEYSTTANAVCGRKHFQEFQLTRKCSERYQVPKNQANQKPCHNVSNCRSWPHMLSDLPVNCKALSECDIHYQPKITLMRHFLDRNVQPCHICPLDCFLRRNYHEDDCHQ